LSVLESEGTNSVFTLRLLHLGRQRIRVRLMVDDRPRRLLRRARAAAERRVAVDARGLAAFRVAVGGLLLVDLLLRARDLTAFYTDAGVLPRTVLFDVTGPYWLSVHVVSGTAAVQALLFALAGAVAVALLVGYRTRTAAVASWVLLLSLQHRNPIVLNGGDTLLRMLLFWAMFVPLGTRWSVDAVRRGGTTERVASVGTAALLLQVVTMYLANGLLKLGGDLWLSGEAIRYVFSLDQFTVLLGDVLGAYPTLLTVLAETWLVMVVCSPLLVLLTGRLRGAFALAFVGAHVGMFLTMQLGIFPFVAVAALLLFLPAAFWDAVVSRTRDTPLGRAAVQGLARLSGSLPAWSRTHVPGWLSTVRRRGVPALVVALGVLVLLVNAQALGALTLPDETDPVVTATGVDQRWNMFAPNPLQSDGWYVVPGELENGTTVDALHGGEVTWERPPDLAATYPNARWRKYESNLQRDGYAGHRDDFATYLCSRWNRNHDVRLETVTLVYMEQPTVLDGPEPVERRELHEQRCVT
jgi:hypothetical protein